jgi:hypothetical protein
MDVSMSDVYMRMCMYEHMYVYYLSKVKLSLYRLWRSLGLREVEAPTYSDIRLTDGGKFVSLRRRSFLPPREDSWYSYMLEAESTPGP